MVSIIQYGEDLSRILNRARLIDNEITDSVKKILEDVRIHGDKALFKYTEKFDKVVIDKSNIMVTEQEIDQAYNEIDEATLSALRNAKENILKFHLKQKRQDKIFCEGRKTTGYIIKPVERAGIYVPGGKAAYPSSVLMCALPAIAAGVDEIIMTTPAGSQFNPLTLIAARECGVKKIFKVGGAQAIAAMAYGTESIPKVNIISGPGNIYVATAKRMVYGNVGIDMIAGPSEIMILADASANYKFIAADMLSQAEHDELALSMLITTDMELAKKVQSELERQIKLLPKMEIADSALKNYGAIVLTKSLEEGIELVNEVAPEHFELCVNEPQKYLNMIRNAGAVFMGNYSPEPLGDYYAGPNHVLPTNGTAKFFSALGVDSYIKKISIINYDRASLEKAKDDIIKLAETEGLQAHANTLKIRFEDENI